MILKKQLGRILSVVLALTVLIGSLGLLTNAEITTSTTSQVNVLTPPDSIDVSSLGTNIVTDPTVAEWDGDTYGTYYSTIGSSASESVVGNANAWWDQPVSFDQRYAWSSGKTYGTLKENNRLTKDVTHTADGSGSIVIKSQSSYLPIQANATPKYFLYTFWAKAAADNTTIMFKCIKSNGNAVGTQVNTKIHSDWTLVTLLLTAGTAEIHGMNVYVESASATAPVYIDDVYMFQLDDTYGETLKAKGKFMTQDDITYASSDTAVAKSVAVSATYNFAALGTNLAHDANVSKFNDGVYDATTGIRGAGVQDNANNMWGSPAHYNAYSSSDSHTNDGSGAIKYSISSPNSRVMNIAPNAEKYTYYLVTFYYKGPQIQLRHYFDNNQIPSGNDKQIVTITNATSDWKRVSYIVYSGSYASKMNMGGYINASAGSTAMFDDFAVYKLGSALGGKSYEAAELLSPTNMEPMPSDKKIFLVNDSNTKYVDFTQFGATIVPDPTVNKFEADGTTYKNYYVDDTKTDDASKAIDNADAWWGKAANDYQHFTEVLVKQTAGRTVYSSMRYRKLITSDTTKSRTADGSGALLMPATGEQAVVLPLPNMSAKTGYVITAWINLQSESSLNFQILNGGLSKELEKQVTLSAGWQRIVIYYYSGASAANGCVLRIHTSTMGAVVDDINVQPLNDDYARECFNSNTLVENKARPQFPAESTFINATFDSNGWPYLYDDNNNVDWDSFGKNLITDPTVKEFNADGTYKDYYDASQNVANANAWWDKAADTWQRFNTPNPKNYGGMKVNGATSNETKYSRTDDGSGVILMEKNLTAYRWSLPKMEANNTYVVSFWVKFVGSNSHYIRFYKGAGLDKTIEMNYNSFNSLNWKRVTFIVYASSTMSQPFIEIYNSTVGFADDFEVYKLTDDEYAVQCINARKIVADGVDPTEAPGAEPNPPSFPEFEARYINATKGTQVYDYSDFDFSTLGTNLIPDPTVKEFNADGTYKAYYADETTGTGVANANAWWGRSVNNYQQFRNDATKPNMWFSPKTRNLTLNDPTLSHTDDGSGVLYWKGSTDNFCIPLSSMSPQSYYLVTCWVKFDNKSAEIRFQSSTVRDLTINYDIFGAKGTWQRVTMLIFTGAATFSEPNLSLYCADKSYVDDVAVYKLDNAYGELCAAAGKIVYKDSYAVETPNVDGYNFETSNNLMTDGSFEDNGTTNSSAKFGSKVFKVTAQNNKITLPRLSFSKYYLISYYVRTKGFASSDKAVAAIKNDAGELYTISTAATNNGWKQVTALVNTGDHRDITIDFSTAGLTSSKEIYVDGVAIHELPAKVAEAASIIDKYKMGVLNADIAGTAKDVFGDAGQSGEYKIWKKLVSPIKSTDTEKVTYASLFTKYYKDYEIQDKISRGFAPSGFGSRLQHSNLTCNPEDNIIKNADCDDATYWDDSTGFVTVSSEESYKGGTSIKVSGEGLYLKKLEVKPNTVYYLSLYGMGYSDDIVPYIHFGIMDMNKLKFENPISAHELSHWTRKSASREEITIKYPDGTWYNRVYQFNTGDNTEVYFFIKGIKGVEYFDDIEIFEAAKSKPRKPSVLVDNLDTINDEETRFACDEKYNLIPNGMFDKGTEFWKNFNGMNKFVEVVTSEGNKMLHYKGTNRSYYYLPTVKLEANKTYTFSFWYRTLNGEKAKFGIVSRKNPCSFITAPREITQNRGEWTLVSITFKTFEESRVSLAIFNKDGEAVFDKIRLFESEHGYELSLEEDMPKGGLTFSDSALGTEGLIELEDEELDEEIEDDDLLFEDDFFDEEYEEDEEGEETEETTKKVIHKYKKKPSAIRIATWFIILMIAVALVVLAGVTFLIIFLVKRKKKKAQTA